MWSRWPLFTERVRVNAELPLPKKLLRLGICPTLLPILAKLFKNIDEDDKKQLVTQMSLSVSQTMQNFLDDTSRDLSTD